MSEPSTGARKPTEIDDALLAACIHCGLCLETCPTFVLTGREEESPRGRLLLARGLAEGRWSPEAEVLAPIDHCLGCRACETACPSGVRYGRILEETREAVANRRVPRSRVERFLVRHVLWRASLLERSAAMYRVLGLGPAARGLSRWRGIPAPWRERLRLAPLAEPVPRRPRRGEPVAGAPRAFLLRGCVARAFFPESEAATETLLLAAGYAVVCLDDPPCCGALAAHAGEPTLAHGFDRAILDRFRGEEDIVVPAAAGCGSHLKGIAERVEADRRTEAAALAGRVRDLSEALLDPPRPLRWRGGAGGVATYQDACHLRHGQGIAEGPRALLAAAGLELREAEESELCCGSAGTYNLAHPELAGPLGARKAERLRETGAKVVVTANPGCAVQLAAHLDRGDDPAVRTLAVTLAARLAPDAPSRDPSRG